MKNRCSVKISQAPSQGVCYNYHRFVMLFLVTIGVTINYLHRIVLGIAAPSIVEEFNIDIAMMGVVFAAFSWTYAMAQIPGGIFLDRFGTKFTYLVSISVWSLFTIFQAGAIGIKTLLSCRLGLGLGQAPCFPTVARVVSIWFPQHERARATAFFTVGEFMALACLSPLLFWITTRMGWRSLFVIVGVVGLLFSLVWQRNYHDPDHIKDETETIENSRQLFFQSHKCGHFSKSDFFKLLRYRQIIGMCIGAFAGNTVLIFFITWFPTYLATECQMEWIQTGFFVVFPFLAAAVGVMFGGALSDYLLAHNSSANLARKMPILIGLLLASNIIWANFTENNLVIIAILSLAFFGQGMSGLGWTLVADIAPQKQIGLTGGICNFTANIAGIVTPVIIGFIFSQTGSFHYALIYIGTIAILGVFSYLYILGDVRRLDLEE